MADSTEFSCNSLCKQCDETCMPINSTLHTAVICSLEERELVSSTPSDLNDCTVSTGELFIVIIGGESLLTELNNISFV